MTAKGKILVLDDDRLVLATVTHGLVQAGYEVFDADNADDAILLARAHRPDLALLDIRMEGKTGLDVGEYLRDVLGLPFMFLSAFSDSRTLEQVKALGAVTFLVKPLDIGRIVPAVEAALTYARAHPPAPPLTASEQALDDVVALAIGVLMQRYSIDRATASLRLQSQADAEGLGLPAHAQAVLDTVEALASGPRTR